MRASPLPERIPLMACSTLGCGVRLGRDQKLIMGTKVRREGLENIVPTFSCLWAQEKADQCWAVEGRHELITQWLELKIQWPAWRGGELPSLGASQTACG